jgi:hypothetical protein
MAVRVNEIIRFSGVERAKHSWVISRGGQCHPELVVLIDEQGITVASPEPSVILSGGETHSPLMGVVGFGEPLNGFFHEVGVGRGEGA